MRFLTLLAAAAGLLLPVTGCDDGGAPAPIAPAPTPPPPTTPAPEPEPSTCGGILVAEVFDSGGRPFSVAEVVLQAHPDTELEIVSPYTVVVPDGGDNLDVPGLRPTVGAFFSGFGFRRFPGGGIHQTFRVQWTGTLELRAEAPDCPPFSVTCTSAQCERR